MNTRLNPPPAQTILNPIRLRLRNTMQLPPGRWQPPPHQFSMTPPGTGIHATDVPPPQLLHTPSALCQPPPQSLLQFRRLHNDIFPTSPLWSQECDARAEERSPCSNHKRKRSEPLEDAPSLDAVPSRQVVFGPEKRLNTPREIFCYRYAFSLLFRSGMFWMCC